MKEGKRETTTQGPHPQIAGARYDSEDTSGPNSELALPSDSHKHTTRRCTGGKQFSSNTQKNENAQERTALQQCLIAMLNTCFGSAFSV